MPSILDIARSYVAAGYSVVPVRTDGSKAPAIAWKHYQSARATDRELEQWFGAGTSHGIALVHGEISGGSEVLDFDDPTAWAEFADLCDDHGMGGVLASCVHVETPSGGWHIYYRYEGVLREGNLKLARKPDGGVRIETRGEGGYTLAPGCPSTCHPSGKVYRKRAGSFVEAPLLTAEERGGLLGLARACNERAEEVARGQVVARTEEAKLTAAADDSPGNDFNARASDADILELLERAGWSIAGHRGNGVDLIRPGKRSGLSATLGHVAPGILYVFSSNAAPFESERAYSPFSVFGLLECGGDFERAARELAGRGFGRAKQETIRGKLGTSRSAFNENAAELPRIVISGKQLPELTDEAVRALVIANSPPSLFVRAGQLCRVDRGGERIESLTLDSLRGILARVATWWKESAKGDRTPTAPPDHTIRDILSRPELWDPFPPLDGIVSHPVVTREGTLITKLGYVGSAKVIYVDRMGLGDLGDTTPSEENVNAAKALLINQLLGDFPFKDKASIAHTVALMILPIVRTLINGPTPFHVSMATTPGSGKSLLVEAACSITRPMIASTTLPNDEEEIRKKLTTQFIGGDSHIFFDNVRHMVDSPTLASALTQQVWQDRILGSSTLSTLPIRCVFVCTGNNIKMSDEITRRSVRITLEPNVERPEDRTGFAIPNLREFVEENRAGLLWALLVLVRRWLDMGRPTWTGQSIGSYESWCRVIGGILSSCGIEGFLTNRDDNADSDPDRPRWLAFYEGWYEAHGDTPVGVSDLVGIAEAAELIRDNQPESRRRLGYKLRSHDGRVVGVYKLTHGPGDKHSKVHTYRLLFVGQVETGLFSKDATGETGKTDIKTGPSGASDGDLRVSAGKCGVFSAHVGKNNSSEPARASIENPLFHTRTYPQSKKREGIGNSETDGGLSHNSTLATDPAQSAIAPLPTPETLREVEEL